MRIRNLALELQSKFRASVILTALSSSLLMVYMSLYTLGYDSMALDYRAAFSYSALLLSICPLFWYLIKWLSTTITVKRSQVAVACISTAISIAISWFCNAYASSYYYPIGIDTHDGIVKHVEWRYKDQAILKTHHHGTYWISTDFLRRGDRYYITRRQTADGHKEKDFLCNVEFDCERLKRVISGG